VQSGVGSMGKELDLYRLKAGIGNPVTDWFTCNFRNYSSLNETFVAIRIYVAAFKINQSTAAWRRIMIKSCTVKQPAVLLCLH